MDVAGKTHYEVLGVPADADAEEIKRAFRRLMRTYHPDVYGPEGSALSAEITSSYDTLKDPEKRAEYDRFLSSDPDDFEAEEFDPDQYEDDWGSEGEWTPQDEPAPDTEGAPPPPEDEPVEGWGEDVVLDDVEVEDTPVPSAQPPGPQPGAQAGPQPSRQGQSEAPKVKYRQPRAMAGYAALAGLAIALCGYVLMFMGEAPKALVPSGPRLVAAIAASVLGVVLGGLMRSADSPRPSRRRRPRKPPTPPQGHFVPAMVVAVLLGALMVALVPATMDILRGAGVALAGCAAGAYVAFYYLRQQKRLDSFVSMKTLKESNTFGTLPGGVAADLLNRDLSALYSNPAMRMMRTPDENKPFTHAVIVGEKVALIRGVMGGEGVYRWSGPSLLRDIPGHYPQEVMRGPYGEAIRDFRSRLGEKVQVETWLFLYDPHNGYVTSVKDVGMPTVSSPREGIEQVRAFFDHEEPLVDHQVVVDTAVALNS